MLYQHFIVLAILVISWPVWINTEASCVSSEWISIPGHKLLADVHTVVGGKDWQTFCTQECTSRLECATFDSYSVQGIHYCDLSPEYSPLESREYSTHWEYRRLCALENGARCSFLYMGHYRISLSSSVVTLPAVSEEDCLLECMSSDTCQIVSYYKGTCQHSSSEQIITSIRSSELGWSQYKKKLCFSKGYRFLAIRTSQSLTTSARPTKPTGSKAYIVRTTPWGTTTPYWISTRGPVGGSRSTRAGLTTLRSMTTSQTITPSTSCSDDIFKYLFCIACAIIFILIVIYVGIYHRKKLCKRNDNDINQQQMDYLHTVETSGQVLSQGPQMGTTIYQNNLRSYEDIEQPKGMTHNTKEHVKNKYEKSMSIRGTTVRPQYENVSYQR